jgi:hypothetical protein
MRQTQGAQPALPPVPQAPVIAHAADNLYTVVTPQTPQDIVALRERRSELSNQLESAAERRAEIAEEIKTAEGRAKAGLEQRMSVLDQRILQLETDIAFRAGADRCKRGFCHLQAGIPAAAAR